MNALFLYLMRMNVL